MSAFWLTLLGSAWAQGLFLFALAMILAWAINKLCNLAWRIVGQMIIETVDRMLGERKWM